mmetsp:Transcript_94043/g.287721  ORF Transcript_94043/g.287721 Transcript_94043/m.287721 type:complete len:223 (-) Transcript_94043:1063-1731(-)
MKIDAQFHRRKNVSAMFASSVSHCFELASLFRIFRTFCLTTSMRNIPGKPALKLMTKHARNQSLVTTVTSVDIILELRIVELMRLAPTSKYIQMNRHTKPAPQKAINVPVRRMDAPATELATHMQSNSTKTMRTKCFNVFSAFVVSSDAIIVPLTKQNAAITRLTMQATKGESHTRNQIVFTCPHFLERSLSSSLVNLWSFGVFTRNLSSKSYGFSSWQSHV